MGTKLSMVWIVLSAILISACELEIPKVIESEPAPKKDPQKELFEESVNFSIQNADSIPPEDIFQEMAYYGFGGGGDCPPGILEPTVLDAPDEREWMAPIKFLLCGWNTGDEISIRVDLPDDTILFTGEIVPEIPTQAAYTFYPDLQSIPGIYYFTFTWEGGQSEHKVFVSIPSEPRLYRLKREGALVLYNLARKENIRLFVYKPVGEPGAMELLSWGQYQVDNNGRLVILHDLGDEFVEFFVIGEVTGQVEDPTGFLAFDPIIKP